MMSNNLHHHYHLLATTIAVLGALFSSILITTAYAQPQQRGPCPEDFTLTRGVCTKPADETTTTSGPTCPDNTWTLTQDGTKCVSAIDDRH